MVVNPTVDIVLKISDILSVHTWADFSFELRCSLANAFSEIPRPPFQVPINHQRLDILWPYRYQWPPAAIWVASLVSCLPAISNFSRANLPQPYKGIVIFVARCRSVEKTIAIDYSDDAERLDLDCLNDSALYFKMQFRKGGYGDPRVVPGLFVPNELELYRYLPTLRVTSRRKTIDVFGRFGSAFAFEVRRKAVELLKGQNQFGFEGGLKTVRYSRYLRDIAASKICIDLPGNGDFCFRLVEYLAVGSCIIGPPHSTTLFPELKDGVHIAFCQSDLSDLVGLCCHYLQNDLERQRLETNSREYFDTYLHRNALTQYYLTKISSLFA